MLEIGIKVLNFFERVYEVVRKIPEGEVMTYGQIALRLRSGPAGSRINISPRFVGWALHANRDRNTPCHRVVNKSGRLAPGYAFGGPNEQKFRLLNEGIKFVDDDHIDTRFIMSS